MLNQRVRALRRALIHVRQQVRTSRVHAIVKHRNAVNLQPVCLCGGRELWGESEAFCLGVAWAPPKTHSPLPSASLKSAQYAVLTWSTKRRPTRPSRARSASSVLPSVPSTTSTHAAKPAWAITRRDSAACSGFISIEVSVPPAGSAAPMSTAL